MDNFSRVKRLLFESAAFLSSHLFIASTGTAALIHSTWSLSTAFSGQEPAQGTWEWLWWVIPGLLLAISIDVGQIATSAQIAKGERTPWKYATFAALAIATYFLQWLYLANHLPLIALGPGVNPNVVPFATGVRDITLWLLPGLLPLSTLLYTFSYGSVKRQRNQTMTIKQVTQTEVKVEKPVANELPIVDRAQIAASSQSANASYVAKCEQCDWERMYDTPRGATNALVAHNRHAHKEPVFSANGHNKEQT